MATLPSIAEKNAGDTVLSAEHDELVFALKNGTVSIKPKSVVVAGHTSDPTPDEGEIWYNTTSNVFKFYDGATTWTVGATKYADDATLTFGSGDDATIHYDSVDNTLEFNTPNVNFATGRVGIGGIPATGAKLEIDGTDGAVLFPRLTATQRDALTAVNGMLVYNSDDDVFEGYQASAWGALGGGGTNPAYEDVDTLSAGTVISEGPLQVHVESDDTFALPGYIGCEPWDLVAPPSRVPLLPNSHESPSNSSKSLSLGTKYSVKGRFIATVDSPSDAGIERFGIGMVFDGSSPTGLGSETESTRDNHPSMFVIVDDSENIQTYNVTDGADASYTDSTYDADLSAGMAFEIICELPSTATDPTDFKVTVKLEDNGGTMRTIFNEAAPASTENGTSSNVWPALVLNMDKFHVENLYYKLERVA